MIVNNIMFKLKDNTQENVVALQDKLLGMRGNVEQLKDIRVEANIRTGFDLLMTTKYEDMQAFEAYIVHPFHVGVAEYVQAVCGQFASVCYEEKA